MSLLLALAALAAATADQPAARPGASAQATATIRVLSGSAIRFEEVEKDSPASLRDTQVRSSDGSLQTVRVVEFQ